VTLSWDENDGKRLFFERLFALTYQLENDLIYLAGQYAELPPPLEVRAALQEGLLLSFYDHGVQSRGKKGDARVSTYEIDDKSVTYRYLPLSWYKHQRDGYKFLLQAIDGNLQLTRTLFPGATERHAGLTGTHVTHAAQLALPLLFAPVGTIALKGWQETSK
jgi:hypothetical protein